MAQELPSSVLNPVKEKETGRITAFYPVSAALENEAIRRLQPTDLLVEIKEKTDELYKLRKEIDSCNAQLGQKTIQDDEVIQQRTEKLSEIQQRITEAESKEEGLNEERGVLESDINKLEKERNKLSSDLTLERRARVDVKGQISELERKLTTLNDETDTKEKKKSDIEEQIRVATATRDDTKKDTKELTNRNSALMNENQLKQGELETLKRDVDGKSAEANSIADNIMSLKQQQQSNRIAVEAQEKRLTDLKAEYNIQEGKRNELTQQNNAQQTEIDKKNANKVSLELEIQRLVAHEQQIRGTMESVEAQLTTGTSQLDEKQKQLIQRNIKQADEITVLEQKLDEQKIIIDKIDGMKAECTDTTGEEKINDCFKKFVTDILNKPATYWNNISWYDWLIRQVPYNRLLLQKIIEDYLSNYEKRFTNKELNDNNITKMNDMLSIMSTLDNNFTLIKNGEAVLYDSTDQIKYVDQYVMLQFDKENQATVDNQLFLIYDNVSGLTEVKFSNDKINLKKLIRTAKKNEMLVKKFLILSQLTANQTDLIKQYDNEQRHFDALQRDFTVDNIDSKLLYEYKHNLFTPLDCNAGICEIEPMKEFYNEMKTTFQCQDADSKQCVAKIPLGAKACKNAESSLSRCEKESKEENDTLREKIARFDWIKWDVSEDDKYKPIVEAMSNDIKFNMINNLINVIDSKETNVLYVVDNDTITKLNSWFLTSFNVTYDYLNSSITEIQNLASITEIQNLASIYNLSTILHLAKSFLTYIQSLGSNMTNENDIFQYGELNADIVEAIVKKNSSLRQLPLAVVDDIKFVALKKKMKKTSLCDEKNGDFECKSIAEKINCQPSDTNLCLTELMNIIPATDKWDIVRKLLHKVVEWSNNDNYRIIHKMDEIDEIKDMTSVNASGALQKLIQTNLDIKSENANLLLKIGGFGDKILYYFENGAMRPYRCDDVIVPDICHIKEHETFYDTMKQTFACSDSEPKCVETIESYKNACKDTEKELKQLTEERKTLNVELGRYRNLFVPWWNEPSDVMYKEIFDKMQINQPFLMENETIIPLVKDGFTNNILTTSSYVISKHKTSDNTFSIFEIETWFQDNFGIHVQDLSIKISDINRINASNITLSTMLLLVWKLLTHIKTLGIDYNTIFIGNEKIFDDSIWEKIAKKSIIFTTQEQSLADLTVKINKLKTEMKKTSLCEEKNGDLECKSIADKINCTPSNNNLCLTELVYILPGAEQRTLVTNWLTLFNAVYERFNPANVSDTNTKVDVFVGTMNKINELYGNTYKIVYNAEEIDVNDINKITNSNASDALQQMLLELAQLRESNEELQLQFNNCNQMFSGNGLYEYNGTTTKKLPCDKLDTDFCNINKYKNSYKKMNEIFKCDSVDTVDTCLQTWKGTDWNEWVVKATNKIHYNPTLFKDLFTSVLESYISYAPKSDETYTQDGLTISQSKSKSDLLFVEKYKEILNTVSDVMKQDPNLNLELALTIYKTVSDKFPKLRKTATNVGYIFEFAQIMFEEVTMLDDKENISHDTFVILYNMLRNITIWNREYANFIGDSMRESMNMQHTPAENMLLFRQKLCQRMQEYVPATEISSEIKIAEPFVISPLNQLIEANEWKQYLQPVIDTLQQDSKTPENQYGERITMMLRYYGVMYKYFPTIDIADLETMLDIYIYVHNYFYVTHKINFNRETVEMLLPFIALPAIFGLHEYDTRTVTKSIKFFNNKDVAKWLKVLTNFSLLMKALKNNEKDFFEWHYNGMRISTAPLKTKTELQLMFNNILIR